MTREEARFHEILLIAGMNDRIGPEIQRMLEKENPLSILALELSAAGSDAKKQLSSLRAFTADHPVDMNQVALMIRQNLRLRMDSGEMDAAACMQAMEAIAAASEHELEEPWQSFSQFYGFYCDAEQGQISMEGLMDSFRRFMELGTPLTSPYSPSERVDRKTSILKRFIQGLYRFFKLNVNP